MFKALQEIWNCTCLGDFLGRYQFFGIEGIQLLPVETYIDFLQQCSPRKCSSDFPSGIL